MNSGHEVLVIPVVLEPHPNADTLSIVRIDGYTVVVKTDDWKGKALGAYIPPDNIVPDTEEYYFLRGHRRIKVRKFRGVISQGLLVDAPIGSKIGEDVAKRLGIVHYEPPTRGYQGEARPAPFPGIPDYGVEQWRKYGRKFIDGEEVVITEKIHGTNARFLFYEKYHVGSHHVWIRSINEYNQKGRSIFFRLAKFIENLAYVDSFGMFLQAARTLFFPTPKEPMKNENIYWKVLENTPWLSDLLIEYPDHVIFGEIFGDVQELMYGHNDNELSFRVFDIWTPTKGYLSFPEAYAMIPNPMQNFVPVLYIGPYSEEKCLQLYQGDSTLANHIKEGIVIRTTTERRDDHCGRLCMKLVSDQYLEQVK